MKLLLEKELVLKRSYRWKPYNFKITDSGVKIVGRFISKFKINLNPLFLPNALLQPQES